ncbi:MAG TPA: hypothetical protein VEW65_09510 [Chryseolinea sp.]|nr:hypothetical protein [Chryseolinea sp.]
MNQQKTNLEFMSKDIIQTLYIELKDADSKTKIDAFQQYVEKTQGKFDNRFIERVFALRELNKYWNARLTKICLEKRSKTEKMNIYREYIEECEIGWYRDYVQGMLEGLKTNSRQQ